jgi:hypothetical protein
VEEGWEAKGKGRLIRRTSSYRIVARQQFPRKAEHHRSTSWRQREKKLT